MPLKPSRQFVHARFRVKQLGIGGVHLFPHGSAAFGGYLKRAVLRQQSYRGVLVYKSAACGRLGPAEQQGEKGGFSAAVGSDDTEAVVFIEGEGYFLKYILGSEGQGKSVYAEYSHDLPYNKNN